MEEQIIIKNARIAFNLYLKLAFVMGVCLAILVFLLNTAIHTVQFIGGDPEVTLKKFLLSFVVFLTAPISALVTAAISYPCYKWLVNRKISMSLTVYRLK